MKVFNKFPLGLIAVATVLIFSFQNCSGGGFGVAELSSSAGPNSPAEVIPPELPPLPPPSKPGDFLTYLKLGNRSDSTTVPEQISFGQVFGVGEVPAGAFLAAKIKGQTVPVQLDKKATHADGSLRHAVLSVQVPSLAKGELLNLKLFNSSASLTGADLNVSQLLNSSYDFEVSIVLAGQTYTASARQALIAAGAQVPTWLRGPIVTEFNVSQPLTQFINANFNIRLYQDGRVRTDVILTNDLGYTVGVKTFTYDVTLRQAGSVVYSKAALKHNLFSNWKKTFYYNGADTKVFVQRDLIHWKKTKAILNYVDTIPKNEIKLAATYDSFLKSDREPMGSSIIYKYMPGTGGRPDIGPETQWSAVYTITQDPRLEEVVLGVADAGGSIPWHYRDPKTQRPVTRDDHPQIWLDDRCGTSPDCPAETWTMGDSGWATDTAHMPSLYYIPYMITGDKYYLDQLQMQASATIAMYNPSYFTVNGRFYFNSLSDQVRGAAWSVRTVANAAYLTPDSDLKMKNYFNKIVDNDIDLAVQRLLVGDANEQGELLGYITGYNLGSGGAIAPWQDDFFTMVYGYLYQRGFTKVKQMLDWKVNFTSGRFLQADNVFCRNAGAGYYYKVVADSGQRLKTWREVFQANYPSCPVEMDGYPNWSGGYVSGALGANATLAQYGYPMSLQAYDSIKSQSTFWKNENVNDGYASDPTFAISPTHVDKIAKTPEPQD